MRKGEGSSGASSFPAPHHPALTASLGGGGCVTNKLFFGDNLNVLREQIADESVEKVRLTNSLLPGKLPTT